MSRKHRKGHGRGARSMAGGDMGGGGGMHHAQYGHGQYGGLGGAYGPGAGAPEGGFHGIEAGFGRAMGAGSAAAGQAQGLHAGLQASLNAAGLDAGLLQDVPAFLRSRSTEQFLLGALIGAAATWVLSDEELRGRIVKSAMKLYVGLAGGFEEMKEQVADIRAEVDAERDGGR